ncbi:MAG: DNA repair protein RecO (recombination protein O) [Verrucomicrobiales bacterium]|jgi:DNA repair protein RecO (recombination protein O)
MWRKTCISTSNLLEKATAILLRRMPLSDTSLIIHWSTEEHGLVRTAARGARRPGSIYSGKLDLFFAAEITFTRSRRGDLHSLREIDVQDYRRGMQKNYGRILCASYFSRLLEMVAEPEAPAPELHDLLSRAFGFLAENDASLVAVRHFEREIARQLGIYPNGKTPAIGTLRQTLHREPEQREVLMRHLGQSE